MAIGEIKAPFQYFSDADGNPLAAGKVYIGQGGLDAETNPVPVYTDAAGTIVAAQPIRTTVGIPTVGGSPVSLFTHDSFSITVRTANDELVYSSLSPQVSRIFDPDTKADKIDLRPTFLTRALAEAASVPVSAAYISVMHDGILCNYAKDPGGTALTTADGLKWSPADATVTFQHWGAVGDGVTDCRDEIKLAVESDFTIVNRVGDVFRVSAFINATGDRKVSVTNGTLLFDFTTSNVGLQLLRTATNIGENTHRFYNVNFNTTNALCTRGLTIQYDPNLTTPTDLGNDRHYRSLEMYECTFGPQTHDDATQYFSICNLSLEDVQAPLFQGCTFIGPKTGGLPVTNTKGVLITGFASPVRMEFVNCHFRSLDAGIRCVDDIEGISIQGGSFVDVNDGFDFQPDTTGYENLAFYIYGVEFNCISSGITMTAGAEIKVSGCTFRQRGDYGDWVGIELATDALAVRDFNIWGNTFSGTGGSANIATAVILNEDVNRGHIYDNQGTFLDVFCKTDDIVIPRKVILIKDNGWADKTSTNKLTAADQATVTTFVHTASSYS